MEKIKVDIDQLSMGAIIKHHDRDYRVVRIVRDDRSLLQDTDGKCRVLITSYVQLLGEAGDITFLSGATRFEDITPPLHKIPALSAKVWRGIGGG